MSEWNAEDIFNGELNLKQHSQLKNKLICNFIAVMNGLIPAKIRKEFVEQCQNVTEETVRNVVCNGITLDSVPSFADVCKKVQ